MKDIKGIIKESRSQEVEVLLSAAIKDIESEGLKIEFGKIGQRTNYALIHSEDHEVEYVGYTFLKDMKYYQENVGKLKSLQQAMARKKIAESDSK